MLNKVKKFRDFVGATISSREELKLVNVENIRKYRDERCYSQEYVANQLGIGQSAFQKIEAGDVKVSSERLAQIAEILGKPVSLFLSNNQNTQTIISQTVTVNTNEWHLIKKAVLQQEKLITALEEKLSMKQEEIDMLQHRLKTSNKNEGAL